MIVKGAFRFQSTLQTNVHLRLVDLHLKLQRALFGCLADRFRLFERPL
jgi:hypothetical protein